MTLKKDAEPPYAEDPSELRECSTLYEDTKMQNCTAFQITEEDIANVLHQHSMRVMNTRGESFETMASALIEEIDHARIEKAALASGCELDHQTQGAFDEIKNILVEIGVLEF